MAAQGRERSRELIGGLLLLGIVAAAVGIFFLDAIVARFERKATMVVTLPDAPGLAAGSPVWIAGQKVGVVQRIEFREQIDDPDARVALTLEIPRDLRRELSAGTRVRLTSARMIGEQVVDIVPGPPDAPLIPEGDTVGRGRIHELEDIIARMRIVRAGFAQLSGEFAALSQSPALRDGRLEVLQRRFAGVSRELEALRGAAADGALARLLGDPALRASMAALQARVAQLRTALGERGSDRAAELAEVGQAFGALAARADSVATDMARIRAEADAAAGTLPRFAADSALSVALRRVQAQLDSLIQEARSNPFRFVF